MSTARRSTLVLTGLILLSFNLRPAAVSVGPVLKEVRDGLGLSDPQAGLLTSLPVLAFAVFGALAPTFARAAGLHRAIGTSLAAVVVGLAGRAAAHDELVFLALSGLALAGMATANVLIPSLVKLHFPDRIGRATAIYTTALAVGLTSAFLLTVPVAHVYGSWRGGLGVWALTALVALVPWLGLAANDRNLERDRRSISFGEVARTRIGWAMALLFGLQSLQAYSIFGWFAQLWRDNGYGAEHAGLLVGIVAAVSIPLSLWLPALCARLDNQVGLIAGVIACYVVGYAMLLVDAHSLAVPAAVFIGIGCCVFPVVLTLIGLRARTADGTAALSGFTQSLGYLLAALGPFLMGAIYGHTGGWTAPLWLLLALVVPLLVAGAYAGRPAYLEDQLGRGSASSPTRGSTSSPAQ
ncbi:MAG TPA: MFS transporter [Nocardioides sp.]|uniref:MFS transporter n=1 Tax=Nocardioides sp. TaxID=35761 RepID=UPI002E34C061|nr:MFS transporter [Nocardioides sp.]HEX3931901.1 MFS transporter [Nocardioides sp.]